VLGELDGEAAIGRFVIAGHVALDDKSGGQPERLGARDGVGVEELEGFWVHGWGRFAAVLASLRPAGPGVVGPRRLVGALGFEVVLIDCVEDHPGDGVGVVPFGLGGEVQDDPVAEDRRCDRGDVAAADVTLAVKQGVRFGGEDEGEAGARSGAPSQPLLTKVERLVAAGPGGAHELLGVVHDVVGHGDGADGLLNFDDLFAVEDRLGRATHGPGVRLHDLELLGVGGVVDFDHEHEAVELRFRERVGPLLLDRILGGEDEEGIGERMILTADGDFSLLHGLEHGSLGLGRRPVDLVGEDNVGEDRTWEEFELALVGGGIRIDDLGPGDVRGHEIRGELDPFEGEVERLGEAGDQEGFRQAGDTDKQRVAAGEDRNQHLFDDVILSDDDFPEFLADALGGGLQFIDGGGVGSFGGHG
jgi:hypothetical protein